MIFGDFSWKIVGISKNLGLEVVDVGSNSGVGSRANSYSLRYLVFLRFLVEIFRIFKIAGGGCWKQSRGWQLKFEMIQFLEISRGKF